jgi:hypothetical protein
MGTRVQISAADARLPLRWAVSVAVCATWLAYNGKCYLGHLWTRATQFMRSSTHTMRSISARTLQVSTSQSFRKIGGSPQIFGSSMRSVPRSDFNPVGHLPNEEHDLTEQEALERLASLSRWRVGSSRRSGDSRVAASRRPLDHLQSSSPRYAELEPRRLSTRAHRKASTRARRFRLGPVASR